MTQKTDKRLSNFSIEFKDTPIDSIAIGTIVECLDAMVDEFPERFSAPPSHTKMKRAHPNGHVRKNTKPKGNN